MPDYLPSGDEDLITWAENFVAYITTNQLILGLLPAEVAAVANPLIVMIDEFNDSAAAQAAAEAATQAFDTARTAFEDPTRLLVGQIQANPTTTNEQRAAMQITVPDLTQTPFEAPTTRPIADIGLGETARHVITFRDELTPDRKAKPEGVNGCEIWHFVGETAPPGFGDYLFLATDSQTPYIAEFGAEQIGKKIFYRLRWVTRTGLTGPWSLSYSATVAG